MCECDQHQYLASTEKDFKPDGLLLVMQALALALADHRGADQQEVGDALRTASCLFLWNRFRFLDCFCFHSKTLLMSKTRRRMTWVPFYFTWLNLESVADGVNPQTKRSKFPPHVKVSSCQRHLERSLLTPADIFPICPAMQANKTVTEANRKWFSPPCLRWDL